MAEHNFKRLLPFSLTASHMQTRSLEVATFVGQIIQFPDKVYSKKKKKQ